LQLSSKLAYPPVLILSAAASVHKISSHLNGLIWAVGTFNDLHVLAVVSSSWTQYGEEKV
jgi:hypothetical protein